MDTIGNNKKDPEDMPTTTPTTNTQLQSFAPPKELSRATPTNIHIDLTYKGPHQLLPTPLPTKFPSTNQVGEIAMMVLTGLTVGGGILANS